MSVYTQVSVDLSVYDDDGDAVASSLADSIAAAVSTGALTSSITSYASAAGITFPATVTGSTAAPVGDDDDDGNDDDSSGYSMAYDDDAARRVLRNTTTDDADVETVGDVDDNIKASDVDEIWARKKVFSSPGDTSRRHLTQFGSNWCVAAACLRVCVFPPLHTLAGGYSGTQWR